LAERDPADLLWSELEVDVVLESTGLFTDGAKRWRTATLAPRR